MRLLQHQTSTYTNLLRLLCRVGMSTLLHSIVKEDFISVYVELADVINLTIVFQTSFHHLENQHYYMQIATTNTI